MTKAELITIFTKVESGETVKVRVENNDGSYYTADIDKCQAYSDGVLLKIKELV